MSQPYRYILRYTIDPSFQPEQRMEELAQFCTESGIAEVMLFFTGEELNLGHPTEQEYRPWLDVAVRVKERLAREGVEVSLNPWTTTHHATRGRYLKPGQDFTTMVGANGVVNALAACPLCPRWQEYLCETFAQWAAELRPIAIWIEDDWRLHNHGRELGYGGCFCRLHLERFAEMLGRDAVTLQEVMANLLAPGRPHPWRKQWLELCRATLLEPAVKLRAAVRAACPEVRIGLMTSNPDVHSIEGRDWPALQEAWGFEPAFLVRPNLPPYTETYAVSTPPSVTRHTLANLRRPIDVYPELENGPRCGRFSKSAAFSVWECLHSVCYGSPGITINHYDMIGSGIALDPTFGQALRRVKDRLSAVVALGAEDARAEGPRVLFHPDVAQHRRCTAPTSAPQTEGSFDPAVQIAGEADRPRGMHQLQEHSELWSHVFYTLGVAHGFACEAAGDQSPVAVSGQTLWAFDDTAVRRLLAGPLLLDADSAAILLERGFGEQIGVDSANWLGQEESAYAYECILSDDAAAYGLARPRMTAQRNAENILAMTPAAEASIRTDIRRADHHVVCPGLVVHHNRLGGRVAALAYPLGTENFFMAFFNIFRMRLLHDLLFELAPDAPLAAAEPGPVHVYRAPTEAGLLLAVLNPTHDRIERPTLRLGPLPDTAEGQVAQLGADGGWAPAAIEQRQSGRQHHWSVKTPIDPLDALFLLVT